MAASKRSSSKTVQTIPGDWNVLQRINGVMGEINYIKKNRTVGKGNMSYKATSHDDVTKATHPLMKKYGLVVIPMLVSDEVVDTGTITSSGTPIIRYEAIYDIFFINKDDPNDKVFARVRAHANDQGDKAPGKALSYAVKNALLKVLMLETGEDDEERIDASPGPLTKSEVEQLQILTEELGFPVDETLQSLANRVYAVDTIEDVPSNSFKDAQRRLRKKAADAKRADKKPPQEKPQDEKKPRRSRSNKQQEQQQEPEDPFGG